MKDYLPEEAGSKLVALVEAVPYDDHMIHGDYHTKNVELVGDEVLLIDMDTLAVGHPIFELASMFNAYIGFSECDHNMILGFQGFDYETSRVFWDKVLAAYLGTDQEEIIRKVEDKARIIGYTRMIRRSIRRHGLESEEGRAEIEHWKSELLELLERTDTLLFTGAEIEVEATKESLATVMDHINTRMEIADVSPKAQMQINIAAEEIYINIAQYAYRSGKGSAYVGVDISGDPRVCTITFIDKGVSYDPLAKQDPDITLSAEERPIGGLGIFMAKKMMDEISYVNEDGQNILVMKKKL